MCDKDCNENRKWHKMNVLMIRIIIRKRESGANLTLSCHGGRLMSWAEAKGPAVAVWSDPAEGDRVSLLLWSNKR